MPYPKHNKKLGNWRGVSPEPGPSKRDRHISSDEEDDPFPKKGSSCSKMSKLGKISKKLPSVSKMGGMHTPCHNKPAELFRKDLISAMKLPDTEILYESEYVVISDPWRQEWEKGVQVPVNEGEIMNAVISTLKKERVPGDFKLPPRKLMHECSDEIFEPGKHELTGMQEIADQIVRYDLDDQDVQWLELVNQEREDMGLQLINEWNLERMLEELENQCYAKTNALKKTEEGLSIEYDEDVACDVCKMLESEDTNEMVFCDGCDICVHQACYGIQTIPEGTWLCRICALGIKPMCLLCPKRGGAMKATKSGTKWTHVSCALWIPEVIIGCPEKMEPITKISNIPPSRWALVCCLCKERVGACIQCSVKQCKTAFHVTCGFAHNLTMRTIVDDSDEITLRAYCPKHSKNRNASDSDSPKKEESQEEDEENDISEAEMAKKRMEKLNQLSEEFYTLVDQTEISQKFYIPEEAVDVVSEYWKLKRKANNNKPLITPKMEEEDQMQRQQQDSLTARMKMFVHLRQDLERARNLCYMISKREKTKRQLFNMKEAVFHAQLQVLTDPELSLSAREAERVRQMARFNSIYSDHSQKSSLGSKPPRENLFTLENLKTPKDHEEEEEEKERARVGEKASGKNSGGKKKQHRTKPIGADASTKKKAKRESVKLKEKVADKVDSVMVRGKEENEKNEITVLQENLSPDDDNEVEETSSKSRLGKVSLKELKEVTEEGETGDIIAVAEEPDLPNKKNLIPCDLQKKLTSILQSKTLMQKCQEKSDSLSESFHIDVENSDSEAASSEMKAEAAMPVEERMNLFDQFSAVQDLAAATVKSSSNVPKTEDATAAPAAAGSLDVCNDRDQCTELGKSPKEEIQQEKKSRHSSHKKAKRRKHSRSSHKHKRPRRSPSADAPDGCRLSVSPIIIKTEGDSIVSKQGSQTVCNATKRDRGDSPFSADNDESVDSSLHSDFQSPPPSFSISGKRSKRKRSRRDRSSDSTRSGDRSSPSPSKEKRHRHQSHLSPRATSVKSQSDCDEQSSGSRKVQETEHLIHLEDLPSPNEDESTCFERRGKLHSKLRLKKQLSPVKGVVSYEVVKDEDEKIVPDNNKLKIDIPNNQDRAGGNQTLAQSDMKPTDGLSECAKVKSEAEAETKDMLGSPRRKVKHLPDIHRCKTEEEKKSKREDGGLRTRHSKVDDVSVSKDKEEPSETEETNGRDLLIIDTDHMPEKRRTRHRISNEAIAKLSPLVSVEDSSDENYRPDGKSPKVSPISKLHRPRRLRTRRQLHPDETDGEDDEEEVSNVKEDSEGDAEAEKNISNVSRRQTNSHRSNGFTRRGIKLKSPLPEKPEINRLLLDPSKLVVKSSLRKRVGERLASTIKGRSRWPTVGSNQPTMDKYVKRTNSCENVFSKPNIVRDPNVKRLSLPLARSDLSPLSVNKSSSVVNSTQDETDAIDVLGSPVKSPSIPTNVIFGAHSSPRGSLNTYRIPRRTQNSPLTGRLKDHNSPLDGLKASSELSSTTSTTDSVFGGAEKLQRSGLRRQLSFENIGSHGDNRDSSDLDLVVNTLSKCDTSKLREDHLDGTQSYRSPSPVSSITSVASSRVGRLQTGRGDYEEDEEENTPTKRVTRSQIAEDTTSPSTRLRNRGAIVKPPKLNLS